MFHRRRAMGSRSGPAVRAALSRPGRRGGWPRRLWFGDPGSARASSPSRASRSAAVDPLRFLGWGGLPGAPKPLTPSVAKGNADGARRPHFRRVEAALACARTTRCVEAPAPTPTRPSDDEHGSIRQDRIPRRRFRATNSPSPGRLPPAMTQSFDWAWSRSFAWEVTRGPSHPCRAAVARAIVVARASRRCPSTSGRPSAAEKMRLTGFLQTRSTLLAPVDPFDSPAGRQR